MLNLMPTDIKDKVQAVLKKVKKDSRYERSYLTAHQLLEKLPSRIRDQLIKERGTLGQGSGTTPLPALCQMLLR